ncbi:MAG: hypothetical protein BWK80_11555 [Desulfobacteraceae bacterium IS3]|nr:MAG: hypothetical protein BWK80_11555 [Desulfobacteraceae bacterium IS3]
MNIFLIGYRCTGKTSAGKALAEKLGQTFADSDSEIVKEQGMSVAEMVSAQGWDFFREKEQLVIRRLCAGDRQVLATGGGVILNPENVKNMRQSGIVVWLKALPETIKQRILNDEATSHLRPSLTAKGLTEEIEDVLSIRTPLYEGAMNFSVDTDQAGIDEICRIIIARVGR